MSPRRGAWRSSSRARPHVHLRAAGARCSTDATGLLEPVARRCCGEISSIGKRARLPARLTREAVARERSRVGSPGARPPATEMLSPPAIAPWRSPPRLGPRGGDAATASRYRDDARRRPTRRATDPRAAGELSRHATPSLAGGVAPRGHARRGRPRLIMHRRRRRDEPSGSPTTSSGDRSLRRGGAEIGLGISAMEQSSAGPCGCETPFSLIAGASRGFSQARRARLLPTKVITSSPPPAADGPRDRARRGRGG